MLIYLTMEILKSVYEIRSRMVVMFNNYSEMFDKVSAFKEQITN